MGKGSACWKTRRSSFPANLYLAPKDIMQQVLYEIQDELTAQVTYFKNTGKYIEAQRLSERVNYDVEMIRELGYCNGVENYSRFFDRRTPGSRPFCLLDYFPKDFLTVIDESHQTIPQVSGMYGGDRSRKLTLVDYGFRLPSALDNRSAELPRVQRPDGPDHLRLPPRQGIMSWKNRRRRGGTGSAPDRASGSTDRDPSER